MPQPKEMWLVYHSGCAQGPNRSFDTREQAEASALEYADNNLGYTYYVCKAVTVVCTPRRAVASRLD